MCMLFIKENNVKLPETHFESLWDYNPDGLAVYNVDKQNLYKTLDYGDAKAYLNAHVEDKLIVHFRMATSGQKTERQLHGFAVCGDWLLFHNGVLSTFKGNDMLSDTQQLAQMFNDPATGYKVDDLVNYLEAFETASRFLIVNINSGEIIQPTCAEWNEPTKLDDGTSITYSNTYAMRWALLKQDEYYDNWSIWKGFDDYDDFGITDTDKQLIAEVEMIRKAYDRKSMLDFVYMNPEFVADYLMEVL